MILHQRRQCLLLEITSVTIKPWIGGKCLTFEKEKSIKFLLSNFWKQMSIVVVSCRTTTLKVKFDVTSMLITYVGYSPSSKVNTFFQLKHTIKKGIKENLVRERNHGFWKVRIRTTPPLPQIFSLKYIRRIMGLNLNFNLDLRRLMN